MVPTVPSDWALRTDCVQLQSICSSLASPPVREDLVIEQARWLSSGSYCLWLGSFSLLSYFPFFFYLSLSHDSHLTFLSRSETLCPHQFNKYTRSPLFSLIPLLLPLYLSFSFLSVSRSFFLSGWSNYMLSSFQLRAFSFLKSRMSPSPVIPLGLLQRTGQSPSACRIYQVELN